MVDAAFRGPPAVCLPDRSLARGSKLFQTLLDSSFHHVFSITSRDFPQKYVFVKVTTASRGILSLGFPFFIE
jgi:hypothetical protein